MGTSHYVVRMTVIAITFKFSMCYTILTSDQTDGEQTVWLSAAGEKLFARLLFLVNHSDVELIICILYCSKKRIIFIYQEPISYTNYRASRKHLACIFDVSHDVCKPWPSPLEIEESFLQFDALCPTLDVYLDWVTISILHFADDVALSCFELFYIEHYLVSRNKGVRHFSIQLL